MYDFNILDFVPQETSEFIRKFQLASAIRNYLSKKELSDVIFDLIQKNLTVKTVTSDTIDHTLYLMMRTMRELSHGSINGKTVYINIYDGLDLVSNINNNMVINLELPIIKFCGMNVHKNIFLPKGTCLIVGESKFSSYNPDYIFIIGKVQNAQ